MTEETPPYDRPTDREDPYDSLGGGRLTYKQEGSLPTPGKILPKRRAVRGRAATQKSIRAERNDRHSSILPSPKTLRNTPPEQLLECAERLREVQASLAALSPANHAGVEIERIEQPLEQPLVQPQQPELPLE